MSDDNEEWRPVVGFEGWYEVSDLGRVRSLHRDPPHIMRPCPNDNGYYHFGASMPGKKKTLRVHQAVAKAFIANPLGLPDVNHLDMNKANNAASNLEWANDHSNQAHATANKVYSPIFNPKRQHKLKAEQVAELRAIYARGGITYRALGKRFGIDGGTVRKIVLRVVWREVA